MAVGASPPRARLEHLMVLQLPSAPPAPQPASPCTTFCPFDPAFFCHPAGWGFWGGRILMDTCRPKLTKSLHHRRGCSGLAGAARGGIAKGGTASSAAALRALEWRWRGEGTRGSGKQHSSGKGCDGIFTALSVWRAREGIKGR